MVRRGMGLLASCALLAAGPATAHAGVRLSVTTGGTGTSCTAARPCSLQAAQAAARKSAGKTDVTVDLAGGTYRLQSPIVFTAADSGSPAHPVVWTGAPGARPVLSGGIAVTGWKLADAAHGIWTAKVPPGTVSRSLYVDGRRAPRTSGALPGGAWAPTKTGFTAPDASVAGWANPQQVELLFRMGNGFWTEPRCRIASVAPLGGAATAVTMQEPCWSNVHISPTSQSLAHPTTDALDNAYGGFQGLTPASQPTAVENVREWLTTPGQWYLDERTGTISYVAKPGQDMSRSSFVLAAQEKLVEGRGTLDAPVHDLVLRGLEFADSTWRQPSSPEGFAEMQANVTLTGENASDSVPGSTRPPQGTCEWTKPKGTCPFAAWTRPPAAVEFHAADRVAVESSLFHRLGAAGIVIDDGSHDTRIEGNEFTDISGSGIQLGNTDDPQPIGGDPRETLTGNRIADNYVHQIGVEFPGAVGIWVGYTRRTVVEHNQISHTPYTAISFGWGGWHTNTLNALNPTIVGDNRISANMIDDFLTTLPDGGAIYTQGPQGPFDPTGPAQDPFLTTSTSAQQMARGILIDGNIAVNGTYDEFAFYDDEGAAYMTWKGNVEYQSHLWGTGGCNAVGHIWLQGNYYAQPIHGYICTPPPVDVQVSDHHSISDNPGPGEIPDDVLARAGLTAPHRSMVFAGKPEVWLVGPLAGPGPVVITGSGFTPQSEVFFGEPGAGTRATTVRVLSSNYAIATPPAGLHGQVDVHVRTKGGTSDTTSKDTFAVVS